MILRTTLNLNHQKKFKIMKVSNGLKSWLTHLFTLMIPIFITTTYQQGTPQTSLSQCTNPNSTMYDGYLDTQLSYAQFSLDSNSVLLLNNPFNSVSSIKEGSFMLWFRTSQQQQGQAYQRGTLLDCGGTMQVSLNGTQLQINLTTSSASNFVIRQILVIPSLRTQLYLLQDWNHLVISIKSQFLSVFFNGKLANSFQLAQPFMTQTSQQCSVGNSLASADSLSAHLRHVTFYNQGFTNKSSLPSQFMRQTMIQTDPLVLAYFRLDTLTGVYDTFSYSPELNVTSSNVTIVTSSEPEQACYCTYQGPPIMSTHISDLQTLSFQNLQVATNGANTLDQNGLTVKFWAYFKINNRNDSSVQTEQDFTVVSLQNYMDVVVVLTSTSSILRVNLYEPQFDPSQSSSPQSVTLDGSTLILNSWNLYEVKLQQNQVSLFMNGQLVSSVSHTVTLQSVPLSSLSLALLLSNQGSANQLEMLVYSLSIYQHLLLDLTLPFNSIPSLKIQNRLAPGNSSYDQLSLTTGAYLELTSFQFTGDLIQSSNPSQQLQQGYFSSFQGDLQWSGYFGFVQQNQQFCTQQEQQQLFDGISCINPKKAVEFQTIQDTLTGYMQSYSAPNLTVDLWFRPKLQDNTLYSQGSLFSNYDQANQTLISLTIGQASGNLSCSLLGQVLSISQSNVSANQDQWFHIACMISQTQISGIVFSASTSLSDFATTTLVQSPPYSQNQEYLTIVGNSIDGSQQSYSFIKEIRILSSTLTVGQVSKLRYSKITKQSWISSNRLLGLISMSEGYQGFQFSSASSSLDLLTNTENSANWINDSDLIICPQNTYFDGTCCSRSLPSSLNISISYKETSDGYVALNASLIGFPAQLVPLTQFNWTVISIKTTNLTDTYWAKNRAIIMSQLTTQQGQSIVKISIDQIYLNSSYKFQVTVDSPLHSYPVTQSYNLVLSCPRGYITPRTNPIIYQWMLETKLTLASTNILTCYNQTTTYQVKSQSWTSNNTGGVPFTIAKNSSQITFSKDNLIPQNSNVKVVYLVTFTNGIVFNDSRIVEFLTPTVFLKIANSSGIIEILSNSDLIIDASQSYSTFNYLQSSQLTFKASCPPNNSLVLSGDCHFNQQTGVFRVPWSNLQNVAIGRVYTINVTFGLPSSLKATANQTLSIRFYQQPSDSALQTCPGVYPSLSSNASSIFRPLLNGFVYTPNFLIDCLMSDGITVQNYNLSKIIYSINTTELAQLKTQLQTSPNVSATFNNTFTVINGGYQFMFKNPQVAQYLKPGNVIPVTVYSEFTSLTNINSVISSTLNLDLMIQMDDIVIVQNSSNSIGNNQMRQVNFEEVLILNASQSYDPDYATFSNGSLVSYNSQVLSFGYFCGSQTTTCQLSPSQIGNGSLSINPLDRVRYYYPYNQNTPFTIMAFNPLLHWKPPQYANFQINFAPPQYPGTSKCPRPVFMTVTNSSSTNKTQGFFFNIVNVTDFQLKIFLDSCDTSSYQFAMFLVQLPSKQLSVDGRDQYIVTNSLSATNNSINFTKANLAQMIGVNQSIQLQASLIFNYTANATKKIGYSMSLFNITRVYASLVPQLRANYTGLLTSNNGGQAASYLVGTEENVYVDSILSFDPDLQQNSISYLYYTCSLNINQTWCLSIQNTSRFVMKKQDRLSMNLTNVNSSFWISLVLMSPGRTSLVSNMTFIIASQNMSRCFSVSDQYQYLSVYDSNSQQYPVVLIPQITSYCSPNNQIVGGFVWKATPQIQTWQSMAVPQILFPNRSDYSIALSQNDLQTLAGQTTTFTLSTTVQSIRGNISYFTNISNLFNYSLTVIPPPQNASILVPKAIDLYSMESTIISAAMLPEVDPKQTCISNCNFGVFLMQNCSNQCTFDLMLIAYQYKNSILQPDSFSSISAFVSSGNNTYVTRSALNFIYNETGNLLNCSINGPLQYFTDQASVLKCECEGYQPRQLLYNWSLYRAYDLTQGKDQLRTSFSGQNDLSSVEIVPFTLDFSETYFYQVVLTVQTLDGSLNSTISVVPSILDSSNIEQGNITLALDPQQVNGLSLLDLAISNQEDMNGGEVFNEILMINSDQSQTLLATKTVASAFRLYLQSNATLLVVNTYDMRGAMITSQIPIPSPAPQDGNLSIKSLINQAISLNQASGQSPTQFEIQVSSLLLIEQIAQGNKQLQTNVSETQYMICKQALANLVTYTQCANYTRIQFLQNTLLKTLTTLNLCINQTLASQILQILEFSVQFSDWNNSVFSSSINSQYKNLLYLAQSMTNLTATQQVFINAQQSAIFATQITSLANGESLNSGELTVTKFISDDWPILKPILVSQNQVQLKLNSAILDKLQITDGYLTLYGNQSYQLSPGQSQNLTVIGDVIQVNLNYSNFSKVDTSNVNLNAQITFMNITVNKTQTVQCGYYNITSMQWVLEQQGGLTTVIDSQNGMVNCLTTHFSMFTVFSVAQPAIPPPVINPPLPFPNQTQTLAISAQNSEELAQRLIVSLVQLGVVIASFILFAIQVLTESRQGQQLNTSKVTLFGLLQSLSPFLNIFSPSKFQPLLRLMIFFNYILGISLFTLINLAILDQSYRAINDTVWLIASIVLVFTFAAPFFKDQLIYKHIQITEKKTFNNIFKPPEQNPIKGDFLTQDNTQRTQLIPQQFLLGARNFEMPSNESNPRTQEKPMSIQLNTYSESYKNIIEASHRDNVLNDMELQEVTRNGNEMVNEEESAFRDIIPIRNEDSDREYVFDDPSIIDDEHDAGVTARNMENLDNIENIHASKMNKTVLSNQNTNNLNQVEEDYEYEGGDDIGPRQSAQDFYKSQQDFAIKGQEIATIERTYEPQTTAIALRQVLVTLIFGGLNGFLFYQVNIQDVDQITAYFTSFLIASGILLIVVDYVVASVANCTLGGGDEGHQPPSCMYKVFIFGFVGINRMKALIFK